MKIIQLSDLHLDETFDFDKYKDLLDKMCEIILHSTQFEEDIYLVCCGDIVNKGNGKKYNEEAKTVFDYIQEKLSDRTIDILFVPGNHDLCENSIIKHQEFIDNYNDKINFTDNSIALYSTSKFDFLLINSVYHNDIQYGKVDMNLLKKRIEESTNPIIVVMHHTLMNRYEDDRSSISNAYEFFNLVEKNNVICVLHGHTHGYSNILIGNTCRVVGVGSLFAYFPNCNNQFNIIDIGIGKVDSVKNYRYHSDAAKFISSILYENKAKSHFEGDNIYELYLQVKSAVSYYGGLHNVTLSLNTDISKFKEDMESNFDKDLKNGEIWLEQCVPEVLYYNHGSYMTFEQHTGIDYVINELKMNSTSNRAIIPLIRFSDMLRKKPNYLPGLTSVQFGFKNDQKETLICNMNLRSLEVNHFLRINLSEAYWLISKIRDEIRSIKKINLNIYTFKAQYKEHFSCFKKAQLDMMSSGEISNSVYKQGKSKIYELLKDKFSVEETIVNIKGLEILYDIMFHSGSFEEELLKKLKQVIDDLHNLHLEYERSSNYDEIQPLERKIHDDQKKCLECFGEI